MAHVETAKRRIALNGSPAASVRSAPAAASAAPAAA